MLPVLSERFTMNTITKEARENRLICATLFAFFVSGASSVVLGAVIIGKISRKVILVADGVGMLAFFLLVFFSRSQLPIFLGIMGMGFFMATIYTSAMTLGTQKIKGNDLGVSTMTFLGSTGGIITPAVVGFVAERAGIQVGMGIVVGVTALLLIAIVISVWSDRND